MQPPPSLPGRPRAAERPPGYWRRHWRWTLPTTVMAVIAFIGGSIGWGLARWEDEASASPPLREAMRRAACTPSLVAALGEPLQLDGMPAGTQRTHLDGTRSALFTASVHGPRSAGRLFVEGLRSQDSWQYPVMYVLADEGTTFDLSALDDTAAAGECALERCRAGGGCAPQAPTR